MENDQTEYEDRRFWPDPLLLMKCRNNKQRKLANIRIRNAMNKHYLGMKVNGDIQDFKVVGVKIKNRIQSCAIQIVPIMPAKEIKINIGRLVSDLSNLNDNFPDE